MVAHKVSEGLEHRIWMCWSRGFSRDKSEEWEWTHLEFNFSSLFKTSL